MKRTDQRNISLGPRAAEAEAGLRELALAFGLTGRKGNGSLSQLLLWLADLYENAGPELVACLHAAADRAGGGDEWSTYAILRDFLPTPADFAEWSGTTGITPPVVEVGEDGVPVFRLDGKAPGGASTPPAHGIG